MALHQREKVCVLCPTAGFYREFHTPTSPSSQSTSSSYPPHALLNLSPLQYLIGLDNKNWCCRILTALSRVFAKLWEFTQLEKLEINIKTESCCVKPINIVCSLAVRFSVVVIVSVCVSVWLCVCLFCSVLFIKVM